MVTASVIVVGSINVDLIVTVPRLPTAGESIIGGDVVRQGGGKSANQAVASVRTGVVTALIGAVGADDLGRTALDGLSAAGVDIGSCSALPDAPTGVALIVVDIGGENQIAVAPGANWALDGATTTRSLARIEPLPGAICLFGLEVRDEVLEAAGRWAVEHGLRVVLNPAPARAISPKLLDLGPILTPNISEARLISGESQPEAAAQALAATTGTPAIVTLGGDGALLAEDGVVTHLPALPVATVDTTGAGDALNGILAAELARGASLLEALRWAVAGASLSTESPGAQSGAPSRAAIEARLG